MAVKQIKTPGKARSGSTSGGGSDNVQESNWASHSVKTRDGDKQSRQFAGKGVSGVYVSKGEFEDAKLDPREAFRTWEINESPPRLWSHQSVTADMQRGRLFALYSRNEVGAVGRREVVLFLHGGPSLLVTAAPATETPTIGLETQSNTNTPNSSSRSSRTTRSLSGSSASNNPSNDTTASPRGSPGNEQWSRLGSFELGSYKNGAVPCLFWLTTNPASTLFLGVFGGCACLCAAWLGGLALQACSTGRAVASVRGRPATAFVWQTLPRCSWANIRPSCAQLKRGSARLLSMLQWALC